MSQNIRYSVVFLDFWHLSSGLSGGARLDNICIKDEKGFCFVPGKSIKGVLREIAAEFDKNFVKECFGDAKHSSKCYFSDATLGEATKDELEKQHLIPFLYDKIASTAIDEQSKCAKDGSLREIEVAKPVRLFAYIANVPSQHKEMMIKVLKSLKRMGLNRNRGLGRLQIEILED